MCCRSLQEHTVPGLACRASFTCCMCDILSGASSASTAECGLLQVCAKGPPRALLQPLLGGQAAPHFSSLLWWQQSRIVETLRESVLSPVHVCSKCHGMLPGGMLRVALMICFSLFDPG